MVFIKRQGDHGDPRHRCPLRLVLSVAYLIPRILVFILAVVAQDRSLAELCCSDLSVSKKGPLDGRNAPLGRSRFSDKAVLQRNDRRALPSFLDTFFVSPAILAFLPGFAPSDHCIARAIDHFDGVASKYKSWRQRGYAWRGTNESGSQLSFFKEAPKIRGELTPPKRNASCIGHVKAESSAWCCQPAPWHVPRKVPHSMITPVTANAAASVEADRAHWAGFGRFVAYVCLSGAAFWAAVRFQLSFSAPCVFALTVFGIVTYLGCIATAGPTKAAKAIAIVEVLPFMALPLAAFAVTRQLLVPSFWLLVALNVASVAGIVWVCFSKANEKGEKLRWEDYQARLSITWLMLIVISTVGKLPWFGYWALIVSPTLIKYLEWLRHVMALFLVGSGFVHAFMAAYRERSSVRAKFKRRAPANYAGRTSSAKIIIVLVYTVQRAMATFELGWVRGRAYARLFVSDAVKQIELVFTKGRLIRLLWETSVITGLSLAVSRVALSASAVALERMAAPAILQFSGHEMLNHVLYFGMVILAALGAWITATVQNRDTSDTVVESFLFVVIAWACATLTLNLMAWFRAPYMDGFRAIGLSSPIVALLAFWIVIESAATLLPKAVGSELRTPREWLEDTARAAAVAFKVRDAALTTEDLKVLTERPVVARCARTYDGAACSQIWQQLESYFRPRGSIAVGLFAPNPGREIERWSGLLTAGAIKSGYRVVQFRFPPPSISNVERPILTIAQQSATKEIPQPLDRLSFGEGNQELRGDLPVEYTLPAWEWTAVRLRSWAESLVFYRNQEKCLTLVHLPRTHDVHLLTASLPLVLFVLDERTTRLSEIRRYQRKFKTAHTTLSGVLLTTDISEPEQITKTVPA
jgi:hypothetical protein